MLIFFFLGASLVSCSKPLIVGFGDSWSSYNKENGPIDSFCQGKDYENNGVAGTTAQQWASKASCCNVEARLQTLLAAGITVSDVWLQIGANDMPDMTSIAANIKTVIGQIRLYYPNSTIVMLGYGIVGQSRRTITSMFSRLNAAVREGANSAGATFMYSWQLLGADPENNQLGDQKYYVDSMHPNSLGFCNIWTQDAMQRVLGCSAPSIPYTCDYRSDFVPCLCYKGNGCENDCKAGYECQLLNVEYNPVCVQVDSTSLSPSPPPEASAPASGRHRLRR